MYLRGNPSLSYDEEGMITLPAPATATDGGVVAAPKKKAGAIRSPAVNKLFQRFNKRGAAAAAGAA